MSKERLNADNSDGTPIGASPQQVVRSCSFLSYLRLGPTFVVRLAWDV
jgi:hypothetical protein